MPDGIAGLVLSAIETAGTAMLRAGLAGLACLLGLASCGFLLAAAHGGLAQQVGPVLASLLIGTMLALVAVILVLLARQPLRGRQEPPAQTGAAAPGNPASPPPDKVLADAALLSPDALGQVALFTACFVLARRLCRTRPGI